MKEEAAGSARAREGGGVERRAEKMAIRSGVRVSTPRGAGCAGRSVELLLAAVAAVRLIVVATVVAMVVPWVPPSLHAGRASEGGEGVGGEDLASLRPALVEQLLEVTGTTLDTLHGQEGAPA